MWREWGIRRLCFEVDTEEYARTRDARVCELAAEAGSLCFKIKILLSYTPLCGQRGCASSCLLCLLLFNLLQRPRVHIQGVQRTSNTGAELRRLRYAQVWKSVRLSATPSTTRSR